MNAFLAKYWIIGLTLFALVGQGMLANGGSMVPVAHANMDEQALVESSDMSDGYSLVSSSEQATDCHGNVISAVVTPINHSVNSTNSIDSKDNVHLMAVQNESDQQTQSETNCCNGAGGCSLDCNHCLTITLTADMMDMPLLIANDSVNIMPVFMGVNRLSIDFPPAFRPPIA
ncbi:hypothetical protein [Shewanella aestuarii]|uniref:CopL family metal-binding regulatory protein n=1 Tax=Shewanella aestuarii TaxID=1028752 RepID=A0A6G9QMU2_9GAMM|nr:hypothetical protein [Shewanella aestuarii]QIR15904.1 hypothetical protein HBH39_16670 [Shewanella aestuarii]